MYKYGGSDVDHNNLGPMHLLYWMAIQDAKALDALLRFGAHGCWSVRSNNLQEPMGREQLPLTYSDLRRRSIPSISSISLLRRSAP